MSPNVVDLPPDFPARLKSLREGRYLTQTDLAQIAGVSPRSVHELESGRRRRALAKTIMLLAEALDLTFDELVYGGADRVPSDSRERRDTPRRGRLMWVVPLVGLVLVVAAVFVLPRLFADELEVDDARGVVQARDGLWGRTRWSREFSDPIKVWRHSPWSDDILLVALQARSDSGGRLIALDLGNGEDLWSLAPDRSLVAAAFGKSSIAGGGFICRSIQDCDLDGDGTPEIVASFLHSRWYPEVVCVIDRAGVMQSQYVNRGHLYGILVDDIDGDRRDEIICAGTNNSSDGATLFILDEDHRRGASVDASIAPRTQVGDSSLVRIVLPNWPSEILGALAPGCRGLATNVAAYRTTDSGLRIRADVGCAETGLFVLDLDPALRPLGIKAGDALLSALDGAGLDPSGWERTWVDAHVRFEEGRRVPNFHLPR